MKGKSSKNRVKKPIHKKWWFWVIIIIVLMGIIGSQGNDNSSKNKEKQSVNISDSEKDSKKNNSKKENDITFTVTKVRNDKTGKWRIATISENINIQDYALKYYKDNFKKDDEIHAIVNFYNKTTTRISVIGNMLDVAIHDYVDKEEHDANKLFEGTLLKEYHIKIDTGKIEEIQ